jgi:hypothetical protein
LGNRQYFWKVRSIDSADVARLGPRPVLSGSIISTRHPIDQSGNKPQNLEEITPATVIWWLPSSDPDPRDRLSYHIEFADSPSASSRYLLFGLQAIGCSKTKTSCRRKRLGKPLLDTRTRNTKDNTLYYFRIIAVDQAGLIGNSASPPIRIAFNLKNDPPLAVTKGFHPTRNMIVKTLRPEIAWEASRDPDFSDYQPNLTYQIELSTDSQFPEDDTRICEAPAGADHLNQIRGFD